MHGLAVYVKEGLPFARDLSLENSTGSYLCFQLALLHSVSYLFFFIYQLPSLSLCTVFDSISSNKDEVLSINPSANVFLFGDLMSIIRTGLPILVELIDLADSGDLKQPYSNSPVLLDLFISSDASICSTMAFLPLGNLSMLLSQFPLTFHHIHSGMPRFIHSLSLCSMGGYL